MGYSQTQTAAAKEPQSIPRHHRRRRGRVAAAAACSDAGREVSPDFAAVAAKMDKLKTRDLAAARRSELDNLQAELGTTEANPVRLEALELLGDHPGGTAADLADKHARLKTARNRFSVLTEAIRLLQPQYEAARHERMARCCKRRRRPGKLSWSFTPFPWSPRPIRGWRFVSSWIQSRPFRRRPARGSATTVSPRWATCATTVPAPLSLSAT